MLNIRGATVEVDEQGLVRFMLFPCRRVMCLWCDTRKVWEVAQTDEGGNPDCRTIQRMDSLDKVMAWVAKQQVLAQVSIKSTLIQ